jgi:FtsK/SpoIIIE family
MTTTYVRRPPKKRATAKTSKPQTDGQQLRAFAWRHRDDLAPIGVGVLLGLFVLLVEPIPGAPLYLAAGGAVLGVALYAKPWAEKGRGWTLLAWVRLRRGRMAWEEKERAYAGGLAIGSGAWACWAALGGVRPWLVFPILVALASIPWWRHRNPSASIPVTIAKELQGGQRKRAEAQARSIIDGWDVKARQGKIPHARLLGLEWGRWDKAVVVELRHGQNRGTLQYRGYSAALESAFDAPMNSLRVEDPGDIQGVEKTARLVRLRFLLDDPNAEPLGPPQDAYDAETISLGRFETGEDVELDEDVHTGVFGMSGAGKSGIMNAIIRRFRWRRKKVMIGFDLKPGAPEFRPWDRVWYVLADNPDKARKAMKALIRALEERGEMMAERGWRKWRASSAEPNIAVFVDEAQELKDHRLMGDLERLAGLMRAYGGQLIVATQHPKDTNLPTTVYNALRQIIGLFVSAKADRVVFGENANRDGWMPSRLPDDGGRFLIRSPRYAQPLPARGYWMEDDDVERENARGPEAVQLDARTAHGFVEAGLVAAPAEAPEATTAELEGPDIVDAELVEETPLDRVLDAIRDGIGTPRAISKATGIPERSVKLYLGELSRTKRIVQEAQRKPWRAVDRLA